MVPAFAEQVEIEIGEDASVTVGVVDVDGVVVAERQMKTVVERRGVVVPSGNDKVEETGRLTPGHRQQLAGRDNVEVDRTSGGVEYPHDGATSSFVGMGTQYGERIAIQSVRQRDKRL
jgi:hypothetical protein